MKVYTISEQYMSMLYSEAEWEMECMYRVYRLKPEKGKIILYIFRWRSVYETWFLTFQILKNLGLAIHACDTT